MEINNIKKHSQTTETGKIKIGKHFVDKLKHFELFKYY